MKEDRSDYKECWQQDDSHSYAWQLREEINDITGYLMDNNKLGMFVRGGYVDDAYDYARTNNVPELLILKERVSKIK